MMLCIRALAVLLILLLIIGPVFSYMEEYNWIEEPIEPPQTYTEVMVLQRLKDHTMTLRLSK